MATTGGCVMRANDESFTCPLCGKTSYNPDDVREGYCGACHEWTGELRVTTLYPVSETDDAS